MWLNDWNWMMNYHRSFLIRFLFCFCFLGNSSNKKRHHHKQQRRQQQTGNSDGKTCDVKTKEENRLEHEDDSDVVKLFKQYATKLDDKQDRYERIVHISRDITIESKRVIFLLHQVNLNDM